MKAVINGNIVLEDGVLENGTIIFDEKIRKIGKKLHLCDCEIIDAEGNYVLPGFIDIHIHGYKGLDVSDAKEKDILKIAELLPENGVTAWCPTTMTVDMDTIRKSVDIIRALKKQDINGAAILGANVEGPFINPSKKGAQSAEFILPPDIDFALENKDAVKLVTVAPEMQNGIDFVKEVSGEVVVSVGHSNACYQTAKNAFECGANHVTHIFNAMPPLYHREPGIIGAALECENVYCEIICDNFHIHPSLFSVLQKLKKNKLVLITDCMRAGGMPDGKYLLGGQEVFVKNGECRLDDGTIAGSILTMNKALANYIKATQIPLHEAVKAVSLSPAYSIGEEEKRGSLKVGKNADIVISDIDINIKKTFAGGKEVYTR